MTETMSLKGDFRPPSFGNETVESLLELLLSEILNTYSGGLVRLDGRRGETGGVAKEDISIYESERRRGEKFYVARFFYRDCAFAYMRFCQLKEGGAVNTDAPDPCLGSK